MNNSDFICTIINDKIVTSNDTIYLTDFFSDKMYADALERFTEQEKNSIFANEIFQRYSVFFSAIEYFFSKNKIDEIVIGKIDFDSVLPFLVIDYIRRQPQLNIKIKWKCRKNSFKNSNFICFIIKCLSAIKLFFDIGFKKRKKIDIKNHKVSIVRSKACNSKICAIPDIDVFYERFPGEVSVYNLFSFFIKIKWLFFSLFKQAKLMKGLCRLIKRQFGGETWKNVRFYYSKRIVHTCVYDYLMDAFLGEMCDKIFVSGNNLDRYAIIEEKRAKERKISTICIPHGLEYGFKQPHCFTGDTFYATSEYAADYLNKLYSTEKFVYNSELMKKIYTKCANKPEKNRNIVFFTEPFENYVNIKIIDMLKTIASELETELLIKLHPKDSIDNYKEVKDVDFEQDYTKAITGNFVIARKSTVLLEALYNYSLPCAVVLIGKDEFEFDSFPSLNSPLITVVKDYLGLRDFILQNINRKSS